MLSGLLPAAGSSLLLASQVVACGVNAIGQVPTSRWDVASQPALPEPVARRVRYTGFVDGAELVDNAMFNISPAETAAMDPQQRQLLEHGYAALHAAGLDRVELGGGHALTGVFLGISATEFMSVLAATPAGGSVYAGGPEFTEVQWNLLRYPPLPMSTNMARRAVRMVELAS